MKKLLVLILVVIIMLCACGKESSVEDFAYEMVDGEIRITGYLGVDRDITIPNEINDRPVTIIGEKAFHEYDMISVKLPDNLRVIETDAFSACNCIEKIVIPEGMRRIEDGAFWSCDALYSVSLPEGLEYMGTGAFGGCDSLLELMLPDDFTGFYINEYYSYFGTPVSRNTVLVFNPTARGISIIQPYCTEGIDYIVKREEASDEYEWNQMITLCCVESQIEYNQKGDAVYSVMNTYNEDALLTMEETDYGHGQKVWNDEKGIYEYIVEPVDGIVDTVKKYTYDSEGNLLTFQRELSGHKENEVVYDYEYSNGVVISANVSGKKIEYQYSVNGELIAAKIFLDIPETVVTQKYIYDSQGQLVEISRVNDQVLERKVTIIYDNLGNLIQIIVEKSMGQEVCRYEFTYNEMNQMMTKAKYGSENKKEEYSEYFYDKDGRIIEEKKYDDSGTKRVKYTYVEIKLQKAIADAVRTKRKWNWIMELSGMNI